MSDWATRLVGLAARERSRVAFELAKQSLLALSSAPPEAPLTARKVTKWLVQFQSAWVRLCRPGSG